MSLKSCMSKAGRLLSAGDRDQLEELAERYQAAGLSQRKAEKLAVRALKQQVQEMLTQIKEGDADDVLLSAAREPADGDRTDVAKLPRGREVPETVALGSLEKSLALARSKSYARGRELKMDIQERVRAAAKEAKVDLTRRTQALHKFLSGMVVGDAKYALQSNENAVGWYDETVSRALGALSTVHPEIESDPKARLAFLWALAVTSNGMKVDMNFRLAEDAYRSWKETGRMPADVGIGTAAEQINAGLALHNELVDKIGSERLAKFMSTEFTAGEIERMLGKGVGGEWKTTPVRGAALLGPKIGNGFFSNLNGYFDKLTMDRWLMRTWGRMTGTLVDVDKARIDGSREKLAATIAVLTDAQRRDLGKVIGTPVRKAMTRAELQAVAAAAEKASMKKDKREAMQASPELDRFRLDARAHHKALDGQKEAPEGPGERNFIRAVFATSLERLRAEGHDMTMSDLQALLWYPERRLYDAARSDDDVADGYEDDEAPDYANAARDLALTNGVPRQDIERAMGRAQARGTVKGRALSDDEKQAMMKEFRAPPAQGVQLAFEVAPDPNDEELTAQWGELSTKERAQITKDVRDAVLDDVVAAVGVEVTKTVQAVGGYAGLVNPNLLTEYKVSKVSLEQARALAAAIGIALDQDSVAVVDPRIADTVGMVRVTLNQKAEKHAEALLKAIQAVIPEVDGFTARGNNFDILNFTGLSNEELNGKIEESLSALEIDGLEAVTSFGDTHSELIGKDSYEGHLEGLRPGSREEVRAGVERARDRARALIAQGIAAARAGRAGTGERATAARRADGVASQVSAEEVEFAAWIDFDPHEAKSARDNTAFEMGDGELRRSTARDGDVVVGYHVSRSEFDAFKPKSFGDAGDHGYYYFAKAKAWSQKFAAQELGDSKLKPRAYEISLSNPLDLTDKVMTGGEWRTYLRDLGIEINDWLESRLAERERQTVGPWQLLRVDTPKTSNLREQFIGLGHDGLIIPDVVRGKMDNTVFVAFEPEQIGRAGDITRSTRRDFLISTAAALASGNAKADVTLGRAKPMDESIANARVSAAVEKILTGNGRGTTNIEGHKALRQAMNMIAATGPEPLRPLAREIAKLLPNDTLMLSVEGKDMNAHGVVEFSPIVRMRLFDGPQKISQGLRYSTLLHESLHTAVLARYKTLNSGVVRGNDKILGMDAPKAAAALEQFKNVFTEFRSVAVPALRGMDTSKGLGLSIEEAADSPDEFFVRALTQPELQAWMATKEYEGKTLMQRFVDWIKSSLLGFKREGTAPSWLDAALLASDDLLKAMGGDPADFKRFRASEALSQKSRSQRDTITRSTSRTDSIRDMSVGFGYKAADLLDSSKTVSWWDKSVGTPYHLAQKHPMFKRVFDSLQNSIADVSKYATRAADMAPSILPKLESMKDLFKSPLSAEDVEKLADPIFKGTLVYTRDADGNVVEAESVGDAGIVWTPQELRDRWGLSGEEQADGSWSGQIGLYKEFRRATNKSIADLAITNMLRYAGADAEGVRGRVLEQTNVKAAAELLADHLAYLAAADTGRANTLQNAARVIKEMANDARSLMAKGYAPLSRFGDYAVYAPGIGEHGFFEMFESERDANRRKRQLEAEFPRETVTVGTIAKEVHQLFKGITPETLALFGESLGLEESASDQQSQVFQEYLRLAKSTRSALKHLIERKGVEGYSNDVGRVLASFVYSNARQAAQNNNAAETTKALFDLKESKQGDLFDHAMKLTQYAQNPQEEAQAVRGLTFLSFIGWNVASAAVNLTQSVTTTLPTLGMHFGIGKAGAAMTRALGIMKSGTGADADLEQALKRAALDGITDPNETHYLQGQAQGSGTLKSGDGTVLGDTLAKMSNGMSKLLFVGGKAFGLAEVMNRKIAFISAYSLAREKGSTDPYGFARQIVNDSQFLTNKGNNPVWARGPIGAVAFQFRKFAVQYLENLVRMWGAGANGKIAVAQSLAILWLLAGLGGMPGGDDLDDLIDGLMQRVFNKSFSSKQAKKEFFAGILGDAGAEFVLNGISGLPGSPIDVSGRLGMGNLLPATGLAVVKQNYARDVQEFAGAAGAMAGRALQGADALTKGEVGHAVEGVLPMAAANVVKAVDMAVMGQYRDMHGRKVIDTTMAEAVLKGIGFQPSSVKNVQDATRTQQELIALNKQRETEIADLWARGRIEKKPDLIEDAKRQLKEWNAQNGASPIEISPSQINDRVKQANMDKATRMAKTAPKEMRAGVKAALQREVGGE